MESFVFYTFGTFLDYHLPAIVPDGLALSAVDVIHLFQINGHFTKQHYESCIAECPYHAGFTNILLVQFVADNFLIQMFYGFIACMDGIVHALPFSGVFGSSGLFGGIPDE